MGLELLRNCNRNSYSSFPSRNKEISQNESYNDDHLLESFGRSDGQPTMWNDCQIPSKKKYEDDSQDPSIMSLDYDEGWEIKKFAISKELIPENFPAG